MTKKDLLQKIDTWGVDHIAITGIKDCVKQFFDSNVCIPKGDNRADCADIWHQIIEGADFQTYRNSVDEWKDDEWISLALVRIKPSEPVYEWQWYAIDRNNEVFIVDSGHFLTEYECGKLASFGKMRKLEETKRVRRSE